MTARPGPMNSGDIVSTATRVNTTVNEKATTPSEPHQSPDRAAGSGAGYCAIALLCSDMTNDSTTRLVTELRAWLREATPGSRLPSTRDLVAQHQMSPVTVQKALRVLTAEGLVESRPGVGTFARTTPAATSHDHSWQTAALRRPRSSIPSVAAALRATPSGGIALHSSYPDVSLLPERLVRSALARASRAPAAFMRAPVGGLPDLRTWFANELGGVGSPTANDVIVVPGSQSGLASVFRSVVAERQPLLVESPTYWGAISAAALAGVDAVPVPSGPSGPDPAAVARAFDETGARAFYAQPNFANPTGAQWSREQSAQVLDVVRDRGAFLIEDDWAHDFGIDGQSEPVAARDASGHVIYVRSLTKSVSPSLRVAAIIARGPVRERILADNGAEAMYVSGLLQAAALDVVTQPGWTSHLRGLSRELRTRRDHLLSCVREHAPTVHIESVPRGGLHLWARLPEGTAVDRLVSACEARGLLITSGNDSFATEPSAPYVRLTYTGPDPGSFGQAARLLGDVLAG
jgi:DNA-binding transcriptional MocR family regulator